MKTYNVTGIDLAACRPCELTVTADNDREADAAARAQGVYPTAIRQTEPAQESEGFPGTRHIPAESERYIGCE